MGGQTPEAGGCAKGHMGQGDTAGTMLASKNAIDQIMLEHLPLT